MPENFNKHEVNEREGTVNTQLKEFIECPKCTLEKRQGQIIHAGDHYYCNVDKRLCGFMLRSDQYGWKVTKTLMKKIIRDGFNEPMGIELEVFKDRPPVNGFIIVKEDGLIGFAYPNKNPVCLCPKCKDRNVIMKYSDKNEAYYYGCEDYKTCGLTLPFKFRNKPFWFKDIIKLCTGQEVSKEFLSKADKKYTAIVFLNKDWKMEAKFR